ncbi:MAG: hypothetical protein PHF46_00865 [Candidatus Gracilibacteria bacterium]|nr:hypothetical protein [Candidatus Gracilibacteria bacterium]MDD3119943.1 hypothetical protein [Candidatus Gracilibacteria bacterium]MDD4530162.1 hypothetical protein [Candidatus Gracilibacteria bacterium]
MKTDNIKKLSEVEESRTEHINELNESILKDTIMIYFKGLQKGKTII